MTRPPIVVLEDSPRFGQENMEVDNRLLLHAVNQDLSWLGESTQPANNRMQLANFGCKSPPIIVRFCYWSEPTLSLGNFQTIQELEVAQDTQAHGNLRSLAWVKRKTGGGAILHDNELTYSIIVPANCESLPSASKGHSEQLYRSVHESVVQGLKQLGLGASLSESCTCKVAKGPGRNDSDGSLDSESAVRNEPFMCFHRRTPVDVVVGDHKILGSAQRRVKSGLLQHGSFLLRRSSEYPALLGLEDILGGNVRPMCWQRWLEERIFDAIQGLIGAPQEVFRLKRHGKSVRI